MLKNHIISILSEKLGFETTNSQKTLIDKLSEFIISNNNKEAFIIKGYAGTGKTTMVKTIVRTLNLFKLKSFLLAPTGRAAKVLSNYTGKSAYTIHKKIYRQKTSNDGFGDFSTDKNLHTDTIFIVDEASMISNQSYELSIFGTGRVLDDLVSYVYSGKNCKLILIGDTAQLPPVGLALSPALDEKEIEVYGLKTETVFLSDIVRQTKDSGILHNATIIRNQITNKIFTYPKIETKRFNDIERISGSELIEKLSEAYDRDGIEETMIVSRSNKRANKYNEGIRNQILWRESELAIGDLLMVVKNNYFWLTDNKEIDFIANGDIVEITRINKYQDLYGFRFADVTVRFLDYKDIEIDTKIILDTLTIETASLSSEENKKLFFKILEDFNDVKSKKKRYENVRENPFFNALQVKFAYAITCHKSQGGQWKNIFVDQGYITDELMNYEYLRWLYTAFTRPINKLYLVNFKKEFFNETED